VRAMQTHAAAAAAAAGGGGAAAAATLEAVVRASRGVDSGRPCKLRLRTAQVTPSRCWLLLCILDPNSQPMPYFGVEPLP
jgi:hypothetical protein